uniref:Uncharacterized protein n=1 Tax=Arion vulgaris TaxID=1028688 RepID=A0A0B6YQY5_9EUPU
MLKNKVIAGNIVEMWDIYIEVLMSRTLDNVQLLSPSGWKIFTVQQARIEGQSQVKNAPG